MEREHSADSFLQRLEELSRVSASRLNFWTRFVNRVRSRSVLEVGVWKGAFAAQLLRRCDIIGRYYMIDPWRKLETWNKPFNVESREFDGIYRAAMDATEFAREKRVVLRGTTVEMIGNIPDDSLDFAYIDGDHTLRGITIDLINVYPKIRPGGFLAGDDHTLDIWQHGPDFEPTLVFPFAAHFAEAVGMAFFALPFRQFLIVKSATPCGYAFADLTGKCTPVALRERLHPRPKRN